MSKTSYVGFDTRRITFTGRCPERADTKLWAFGYADLAAFVGCSENTIRGAVSRGAVDPSDLQSLVDYKDNRRPVVRKVKKAADTFDPGYSPYATFDFDGSMGGCGYFGEDLED